MVANITLLKSFIDGQGAGAGTYTAYAADFDANFATLETSFNALAAEFRAFGGQNAALVLDLTQTQTLQVGFIGALSFVNTFQAGNTQMSITRGEAMTSTGRLAVTGTTVLTGSGSSGTRYVALRSTGVLTLETVASQGALDLYSVNWNGASFDTNTLVRLPGGTATNVIVDADDFQRMRVQEAFGQTTNAVIPGTTYDQIGGRLDDIVRIMGARLTSSVSGGPTLKAMAFGGSVATAGFMTSDGSTYDPTSGFFRAAANVPAVTVQGTELLRWSQSVASQPQELMRAGTVLTSPPWSWNGDLDSGFGYVASDQWRAIAGGVSVLEFRTTGGNPKALAPLGAVGNPTWSFQGDENTGVYSPGADQWAVATNGVQALLVNANQQRVSATQGRCSASQSGTQNLANNTITNVAFNAEDFDVGSYHDNVTNNDRFTVPTGFNGLHSTGGYITFNEASAAVPGVANVGQRTVQVTVNGTVVAEVVVDATLAGDTKIPIPAALVNVVATDIIRFTAAQNCGGTMNITASRGWVLHED